MNINGNRMMTFMYWRTLAELFLLDNCWFIHRCSPKFFVCKIVAGNGIIIWNYLFGCAGRADD